MTILRKKNYNGKVLLESLSHHQVSLTLALLNVHHMTWPLLLLWLCTFWKLRALFSHFPSTQNYAKPTCNSFVIVWKRFNKFGANKLISNNFLLQEKYNIVVEWFAVPGFLSTRWYIKKIVSFIRPDGIWDVSLVCDLTWASLTLGCLCRNCSISIG